MLWFLVLLAFVLIAAVASLVASKNTRRDLGTGRPRFNSVADSTGIWNRSRLDDLVGPRDDEDRYTVTADVVRSIPPTWWKRWFDGGPADVGCIVLSLIGLSLIDTVPALSWASVAASATYLGIGYVGGILIILQNRS